MEIVLMEKSTGDLVTLDICKIHGHDPEKPRYTVRKQIGDITVWNKEQMITIMEAADVYELVGVL